jgi:poly-gamma-glutamate synthesis protein (capsule biosynthesis protein)
MFANPAITFFAVCILVFQVCHLHPHLIVPNFSSGEFRSALIPNTALVPQQLYQAEFSSYNFQKRDAIVFTGDVMLARNVEFLMKKNGFDFPFKRISLPNIAPNPAIVGNFESAIPTTHITTQAMEMNFSVDPLFLPALKDAGFTHVSLANNHSFDYREDGFKNAQIQLQSNSLTTFGSGETVDKNSITYINSQQGRIALIAINASERVPDESSIQNIMAMATQESDAQIVYIHWGTEYERKHSPAQETLAKYLVKAGADLIIGHHPHVVQDVGQIDNVIVFYSLGNFIFDQYFSKEVQEGLVVVLDTNADIPRALLLPVSSLTHPSQPSVMPQNDRSRFLASLAALSDPLLKEALQTGIIDLPHMVASSQKMAIMVR